MKNERCEKEKNKITNINKSYDNKKERENVVQKNECTKSLVCSSFILFVYKVNSKQSRNSD